MFIVLIRVDCMYKFKVNVKVIFSGVILKRKSWFFSPLIMALVINK